MVKSCFTKTSCEFFAGQLGLEIKNQEIRLMLGSWYEQIPKILYFTEENQQYWKVTSNSGGNKVYYKLSDAFSWLLGHCPVLKIDYLHSVSVSIKIGDLAQIKTAQYKLNWEPLCDWENLKHKDFPLALQVVKGEIGVEFVDYLQDFYGVNIG